MSPSVDLGVLLNAIDRRQLSLGLAGLAEPERVLFLVSSLFFEVDLGGFDGYYYNSAGNHAVEAARALEVIGAPSTAMIVRAANGRFASGAPPEDRDTRCDHLQALSRDGADPFHDDDRLFYHRTGEDIDALMEQYAETHRDALPPEAWHDQAG